MPKSKLTDEAKVEMVLISFNGIRSVKEYCNQNGISRSTFYTWRRALLVHLSKGITSQKPDRSA